MLLYGIMVPAAIYQPLFYFLFYFFNLWFAILLCNRILYGCWMQVLLLFHRQTRKCIWCYIECHYGIVTYVHLIIATNVIHQICMTSGYTQWTHSSVLTCPSTSEFILDSQSKHRGKLAYLCICLSSTRNFITIYSDMEKLKWPLLTATGGASCAANHRHKHVCVPFKYT